MAGTVPAQEPTWTATRAVCTVFGILLVVGGGVALAYGMALFATVLLIPLAIPMIAGGAIAVLAGLALAGVPWVRWLVRRGRGGPAAGRAP